MYLYVFVIEEFPFFGQPHGRLAAALLHRLGPVAPRRPPPAASDEAGGEVEMDGYGRAYGLKSMNVDEIVIRF